MNAVTLFLCGDVMTGRGIDQILPHRVSPRLYEHYVRSALDYVALAEERNGPIAKPVDFAYVWGDALAELDRRRPAARIVNLETAVTTSDEPWPGKGIHYRMHPGNVPVLAAAHIHCCVLANNHVLDWGREGLVETIESLHGAGLVIAGAGRDQASAEMPAILPTAAGGRVLVFAFGAMNSGISADWAATADRPGIALVPDFGDDTVHRIAERVRAMKRNGDIAIASLHWGENWGYDIPGPHRSFAHRLIDEAAIDVVHGHSSHHPLGIEVYRERLVLYGCGDLVNDYEGIGGYESFRADLALMYFAAISPADGVLVGLELVPMQMRRLRLNRPSPADAAWLHDVMGRECSRFGSRIERDRESLTLHWRRSGTGAVIQ